MKPDLPWAKVRGELYRTDRAGLLTQDMLEVELPGKVFVDVGWFPEHDPAGEYVVTVFAGDIDHLLQPPFTTRSHAEALAAVHNLAARFRNVTVPASESA